MSNLALIDLLASYLPFFCYSQPNSPLERRNYPSVGTSYCVHLFRPRVYCTKILGLLNNIWFLFGQLLHKITNPILMGLIFFRAMMPTGLLMRLCGKKLLDLNFNPTKQSYWKHCSPPSPGPRSMKQQF